MNDQEKMDLSQKILQVIENLQSDSDSWVEFASIGAPLVANGVQYKKFGFPKLRPFLNEFQDILSFKDVIPDEGKPPVCYVRPKSSSDNSSLESLVSPSSADKFSLNSKCEKIPSENSWLFQWASIPKSKIKRLSELALEERWYYGETPTQEEGNFPILENYLKYTFKRLCFEKKILIGSIEIGSNPKHSEEYAAFNTGLVDKKYEYIYALFKQNTQYPTPYWYLLDFVVAGEDIGKTLVKIFNPLPERANYFENKIENMLYDTSTGNLSCDYKHIITERTYRLPVEFLENNCSPLDFLRIGNISIRDVYNKPDNDETKRNYYAALGKKIEENPKILNRLKNGIEDAARLALKRVEWNYKTAIPMYFPTKNSGSLLLPLCLVNEDNVDLALVVERTPSGAYQGETILPLRLAYSNSRLVTRPDSDWLKTDAISAAPSDNEDESDQD